MLLGVVTGKVWATKKCDALTGQTFLTVEAGGAVLVCADCVGAGEGETVLLKNRLYELEERLAGGPFLRVSHGELVNFDHVRSLDLSMAGTISLRLDNGDAAFVSRRNMGRIKSYLGI